MEKKVLFNNSRGLNLTGIISIPENQTKVPFVMICHGLYSSKNGSIYAKLAEVLFKNNIASFRFDFIGHGESEGDTSDLTFSQSVEDLKEAFKVVYDYNAIDISRVGLFGRSFGGNISLRYAAQMNNLKLLCLNSPAINWGEIYKNTHSIYSVEEWEKQGYIFQTFRGEKYKLDYNFYIDSVGVDIYEICKDIKTKVFIVHGGSDDTVPCQQSIRLKDRIGDNASIVVINGADHGYNPDKQEEAIKLCSDFIIDNL